MNLCCRCNGNGVIKIRGGIAVCPDCHGACVRSKHPVEEQLLEIRKDADQLKKKVNNSGGAE